MAPQVNLQWEQKASPLEEGSCDVDQGCKTQILIREGSNVINVTKVSQATFVIRG